MWCGVMIPESRRELQNRGLRIRVRVRGRTDGLPDTHLDGLHQLRGLDFLIRHFPSRLRNERRIEMETRASATERSRLLLPDLPGDGLVSTSYDAVEEREMRRQSQQNS